jgi:hypothetical protein
MAGCLVGRTNTDTKRPEGNDQDILFHHDFAQRHGQRLDEGSGRQDEQVVVPIYRLARKQSTRPRGEGRYKVRILNDRPLVSN